MHTKEPWKACVAGKCQCGMIWSAAQDQHIVTAYGDRTQSEFVIAGVHLESGDEKDMIYSKVSEAEREANAARIVACVNALAGIETDKIAEFVARAKEAPSSDAMRGAAEAAIKVLRRHGLLVDEHGTRVRVREMATAADNLAAALAEKGE